MRAASLATMATGLALAACLAVAGEKQTFLGVATAPVDPVTAAQLDLDGGLVVTHVEADSGADGKLELHDILLKLGDQILVNQEQLATLVRRHAAGDEVELEVLRKAAKQQVKVTLGERDAVAEAGYDFDWSKNPFKMKGPMVRSFRFGGDDNVWMHPHKDVKEMNRAIQEAIENAIKDAGGSHQGLSEEIEKALKQFEFNVTTSVTNTDANIVSGQIPMDMSVSASLIDAAEGHTYAYRNKNGKGHLTIKDQDGKVLFEGPVETDEDKAKIPETYRENADQLMQIQVETETKSGSGKAKAHSSFKIHSGGSGVTFQSGCGTD